MPKPALGRGLGALLGSAPTNPTPPQPAPGNAQQVLRISPTRIVPCLFQPRKEFSPEALAELANSIREQGIVQPLIVRPKGADFELIAGERRWRAAQLLGLNEVPVIVREADDRAALELALIENLQREDLNPIEEALGYSQLSGQFQLKQEEVSQKVGKSRTAVANALRLLKLPAEVQNYLRDRRLSVGHAKAILGLARPEEQLLAAQQVIRKNLNVRQTEDLVTHWRDRTAAPTKKAAASALSASDPHLADLANRLQQRLATKVRLRYHDGRGAIEAFFFSDDELQRLLELLGVQAD